MTRYPEIRLVHWQLAADHETYGDNAGRWIITTADGAVTLRGPVKSDDERKKIGAMAEQVAGTGRVQNHLEVAPPK